MGLLYLLEQVPTYHLLIEGVLLVWVLWLLLRKSTNTLEDRALSEKEKQELIVEWDPEPLVPASFIPDENILNVPVVESRFGKEIIVNSKKCLNMASHNYLNLSENNKIDEKVIECLKEYGVGSCGPRGFYGTTEPHLNLESKIASFLGVEEVALYSYGYSAIASAIPAYSKRGDVIFVDDGVSFPVQKGVEASRSHVYYFKHNDLEDLERVIKEQVEKERKQKKAKEIRKFIVVEGIYLNSGDICRLPELVELKFKYKIRLFIEESVSFGVLGSTGKGVVEHFGVPMDHIDMVTANIEYAAGSIGGFCAGTSFVIDHQRLSGLGYCFSASLPPPLAAGAIAAVELMEEDTSMFLELKRVCRLADKIFTESLGDHFTLTGNAESPVKHLRFIDDSGDREAEKKKLRNIVSKALDSGVCFVCPSYLEKEEKCLPRPSIRLTLNCRLSEADLRNAAETISKASSAVLSH